MPITKNDLHQQFAEFFKEEAVRPFAYLLSKKLHEGHICIDVNEPGIAAVDMPYAYPEKPELQLRKLKNVSAPQQKLSPFVFHQHKLYFQRYFQYETSILTSLARMLRNEQSNASKRWQSLEEIKDSIATLQDDSDVSGLPTNEQADWQLIAAICAVLHDLTIITGGPGTGKTTTVAKILTMLYAIDPLTRVALAAPTGKAAVRMADSLKETSLKLPDAIREKFNQLVPATLHRLLKYIPGSIYFKHNASHPLPFDVIIVDEASMIDVPMLAKLFEAIPDHARIILLGDKNQLASVEAGSILGDLCKSQLQMNLVSQELAQKINDFISDPIKQLQKQDIGDATHPLSEHIVELQRSRRFTSSSGIGRFSKAVISNDSDVLNKIFDGDIANDVELITEDDAVHFEKFVLSYKEFMNETDIKTALQKLNKFRILVAVREGDRGLYAINEKIETILRRKGHIKPDTDFYENRPVIVTKNFPDLNLFNGDIGIVRADANGQMRVWFEDANKNIRSVMPGYIAGSETVYAMTIHKSQGSEYDHVWVVLPKEAEHQLMTRELLYTAVTRAKKTVVVQATRDAILKTAAASVQRTSGINERFGEIA